ncbi:MAG: porphobilinogen synthase [Cyanobacteria bacterium]|nr:porphobilinogen synthase [Cyanobacteriota bacterium]
MSFPLIRMRRLRKSAALRELAAETRLTAADLVYPMFINDQVHDRVAVSSMPGIYQESIDYALRTVESALNLGVKQLLLFGIPDEKDAEATSAWSEAGVVQKAIQAIKNQFASDVVVIADTCLCEYMNHGHCGIVMDGKVLNDPTLDILARTAVSQAEAGADIIAPSDMMDGRVAWIRQSLDDAGYDDIPILSYSAKYASAFYAPFRDAADSAPAFGDRKTYQMDPRNAREALIETELDLIEGADMVMVKPALSYLDVIYRIRQAVNLPLFAYSVSGEYSMIKAAAEAGWIDEQAVVLETLTSIKRAGADRVITYSALDAAEWLRLD